MNKYNNEKIWNTLRITKCDTEMWTEQMLLEKWCQQTYPKQSCHKLLIKKKKKEVQ